VPPGELAEASIGLVRAFAAIAEASLEATKPELTLQQFRALTVLHERGPQNAASLAAALGIAPSTLTRLANRLVRDGLVDRVTDPTDRRAVMLSATALGARTARRVKAWRLHALARQFGAVPTAERATLLDSLVRCGEVFTTGDSPWRDRHDGRRLTKVRTNERRSAR
jgi:DNA-binding MarR family transcriptional regulator